MGGLFIHVLSHFLMQVTIHSAYMWYEVDGQAELSPYGYYAVPYVYGSLESYDDEPVACGPQELTPITWDINAPMPF